MEIVGLLLVGLLAVWVYQDARSRGEQQAGLWALGTFLLAIIVIPVWLVKRPAKGSSSLRPCPHCAEQIQLAATLCRFCHRDVPPAGMVPPRLKPRASTGVKVALGTIAGLILLVSVAAVLSIATPSGATTPNSQVAKEATTAASQSTTSDNVRTAATSKLMTVTDSSGPNFVGQLCEDADLSQVTPDIKSKCITAHLTLTANFLKEGKVSEARKAFDFALKQGASPAERAAAEKLLMQAMDAEAKRQRAAETAAREAEATSKLNARVTYAGMLRERYLDQSMNIKVSVDGAKKDRITLNFILFNEVWAHKLQKGDLLDEMRRLGFTRVDMTDGHDYHVYWTLKS